MADKKGYRRVSLLLNTQTIFHLNHMAACSGYKELGRVVDKLVREKMLAQRDATRGSNTCVCCGEPIPEGRMVCPVCAKEL